MELGHLWTIIEKVNSSRHDLRYYNIAICEIPHKGRWVALKIVIWASYEKVEERTLPLAYSSSDSKEYLRIHLVSLDRESLNDFLSSLISNGKGKVHDHEIILAKGVSEPSTGLGFYHGIPNWHLENMTEGRIFINNTPFPSHIIGLKIESLEHEERLAVESLIRKFEKLLYIDNLYLFNNFLRKEIKEKLGIEIPPRLQNSEIIITIPFTISVRKIGLRDTTGLLFLTVRRGTEKLCSVKLIIRSPKNPPDEMSLNLERACQEDLSKHPQRIKMKMVEKDEHFCTLRIEVLEVSSLEALIHDEVLGGEIRYFVDRKFDYEPLLFLKERSPRKWSIFLSMLKRPGLKASLFFAFLLMLVASIFLYYVLHSSLPEAIASGMMTLLASVLTGIRCSLRGFENIDYIRENVKTLSEIRDQIKERLQDIRDMKSKLSLSTFYTDKIKYEDLLNFLIEYKPSLVFTLKKILEKIIEYNTTLGREYKIAMEIEKQLNKIERAENELMRKYGVPRAGLKEVISLI
ncbi:MAG: hypothetical protein ACTSX9_06740 [Candidatus Njordarchaeales archaeon]